LGDKGQKSDCRRFGGESSGFVLAKPLTLLGWFAGHPDTSGTVEGLRGLIGVRYEEATGSPGKGIEASRRQEMRDFRATPYAREATNKTPPNMSVSPK